MFTLEQLRAFVAVAEERSFSRAAERLQMTQPPLSRSVQKLERSVGIALLERGPGGTAVTPGGRVFLEEARRILALSEAAPLSARAASTGTRGAVRIGFTAVTALTVLGRWIRLAGAHLPDVDLVLTEMVTNTQIDALLAGTIDVGLGRGMPRSELLAGRLVHAEPFVLAAPAGHPLMALERRPLLVDIAEHAVITYAPVQARYLHEMVVATFRAVGVAPSFVQHVTQVNSVIALVDAGVGVALVPASARAIRLPNVEFTPIAGVAPNAVQSHTVWRRDNASPALHALLGFL